MANFRILKNVILDGVAYQNGNVLDLGFLADGVADDLVSREVIATTNDDVTVVHGSQAATGSETIASPEEEQVATSEGADNAPLTGAQTTQTPTPQGKTAEEIQAELAASELRNGQ